MTTQRVLLVHENKVKIKVIHTQLHACAPIFFLKKYISDLCDDFLAGLVHSHIKILDLSHNNISRINAAFFRPIEGSVISLDLSFNYLTVIICAPRDFLNLTFLFLQNTSRDIFGNFYKLQQLDLSDNFIDYIAPDTFRNSRKLQVIDFHQNELTEIGAETFRNLNDLRIVDLSSNLIRGIPESVFISDDMEKLDISHNQLSKVPVNSITNVAALSLCELDLSFNNILSIHSNDFSNKFRVSIIHS